MKITTAEEVKNYLKKNKHYDFSTDFWDDEVMVVLYECIEACNHLHASQFRHEISEEEIERMAEDYGMECSKYAKFENTHIEFLQDAFFEGCKSMIPYTRKQEWISVYGEDSKPPISRTVLLNVPLYENVVTGFWDGSKFNKHGHVIGEVTHWMPLPEPPVK